MRSGKQAIALLEMINTKALQVLRDFTMISIYFITGCWVSANNRCLRARLPRLIRQNLQWCIVAVVIVPGALYSVVNSARGDRMSSALGNFSIRCEQHERA